MGGMRLRAILEDDANNEVMTFQAYGGTADTTKGEAAVGLITYNVFEHNGSNSLANITANGNIFSIRAYTGGAVTTKWHLDEDGDTWQSGGATILGNVIISPIATPEAASVTAELLILGDNTDPGTLVIRETSNDVEMIMLSHVSEHGIFGMSTDHSLKFRTNNVDRMYFDIVGGVYINETLNAHMTLGLTINQGGNDNEILAFKSTDIAHGHLIEQETDTFFAIQKRAPGDGGCRITTTMTNSANTRVLQMMSYGGTAVNDKTSSGLGLVQFYIAEHNGSGSLANITADGVVFAITGQVGGGWRTLFMIDEDGDFYYDGVDGGSYDQYEDAQLVRALSLATSKDVIRTQWDEAVRYNENSLVEAGILGASVAEGGLVNGAQLQRLHSGAIWQLYQTIQTQALQIESLESKLKLLEM
jgi:hypothetical protein